MQAQRGGNVGGVQAPQRAPRQRAQRGQVAGKAAGGTQQGRLSQQGGALDQLLLFYLVLLPVAAQRNHACRWAAEWGQDSDTCWQRSFKPVNTSVGEAKQHRMERLRMREGRRGVHLEVVGEPGPQQLQGCIVTNPAIPRPNLHSPCCSTQHAAASSPSSHKVMPGGSCSGCRRATSARCAPLSCFSTWAAEVGRQVANVDVGPCARSTRAASSSAGQYGRVR